MNQLYKSLDLKKTLNIVITILVILIIVVGLSFITKRKKNNTAVSPELAQNIQFPYQTGDSLYFYTGSTLAKLDLTDYKTETLIDENTILPNNPSNVQFSDKGALLSMSRGSIDNYLGVQLLEMGYSSKGPYLWYIPFASSKPVLISASASNSFISRSGDLIYYTIFNSTTKKSNIFQYDIKSKQHTDIGNEDFASRVVFSDNHSIFVLVGDSGSINLVTYNFDSNSRKTIVKNIFQNPGATIYSQLVMPTNNSVVFLRHSDKHDNLTMFNIGTQKYTTLAKSFIGSITSSGENVVASNLQKKAITFNVINSSKAVKKITINQPTDSIQDSYYINGRVYFINNRGSAFFASEEPITDSIPGIKKNNLKDKLQSDDYVIYPMTSGQTNDFIVTILKGSYRAQVKEFKQKVERAGYDANQFNFFFQAGSQADIGS